MEVGRSIQTSPTQDSNHHEDEVFDTLSLSDFMIYDNNGDPQDFFRLKDENPSDFDDQFEFSSELLKTSMNNSVVFCGKIIPYKESSVSPNTHKLESKKLQTSHKQRWRFFKKSSKSKTHMIYSEKHELKYEVPIRRVSILTSATKPRWYLLMFGFGSNSYSAQMHIRDLKKRQTSIGTKDRMDDKKSGGDDGGRESWSLVRFLGCGGGGGGGRRGGDSYLPNAIKNLE
ncbi:hypothetical protein HanRHA438_Chr07g0318831 [Helianthus annuus]|nr:hypothetical protein HanIR_Chr07g0334581 [Helianthus annuus]KAJ0909192.1 hypothetical protein HanRHA438_Chr07g0318831 [Helianthus annuus]